jgi:uridine kinase
MNVQPVLDALARLTASGRPLTLVGIGGHGGAGKSTLAAALPATAVVGTDEFWDGTSFDLRRLAEEVFEPLLAGRPAVYRSFDWGAQRARDEPRAVAPAGLVVVEGVCALHRRFRDAYDLRVWVDAPRDLRLARGVARDGEEARGRWLEVWMPLEDRYVDRDDPVSAADLVVDGSGEPS